MPKIVAPRIFISSILSLLLTACSSTPERPSNEAPRAAQTSSHEGAIELDWKPPTDRVNGQRLSQAEISGYRIYVGDQPGKYSRTIDIRDPQTTDYVVRGLLPGTEYFVAITTIDRDGRESPKSAEVSLAAEPLTDTQFAESEHTDSPGRDGSR